MDKISALIPTNQHCQCSFECSRKLWIWDKHVTFCYFNMLPFSTPLLSLMPVVTAHGLTLGVLESIAKNTRTTESALILVLYNYFYVIWSKLYGAWKWHWEFHFLSWLSWWKLWIWEENKKFSINFMFHPPSHHFIFHHHARKDWTCT